MSRKTKIIIWLILIIALVILSRPAIDFILQKNTQTKDNPKDKVSSESSKTIPSNPGEEAQKSSTR
jgi:hypothetical protein